MFKPFQNKFCLLNLLHNQKVLCLVKIMKQITKEKLFYHPTLTQMNQVQMIFFFFFLKNYFSNHFLGVTLTSETSTQPQISDDSINKLIDQLPNKLLFFLFSLIFYLLVCLLTNFFILIFFRQGNANNNNLALVRSSNSQSLSLPTGHGHSTPKPKWHPPWKMMRVIDFSFSLFSELINEFFLGHEWTFRVGPFSCC